jgi:cysteine-rich repeat protein
MANRLKMIWIVIVIFVLSGCDCGRIDLGGGDVEEDWNAWEDGEDINLDEILQLPEIEEMPEFVREGGAHDPYPEDAPAEPWVPDFWDVDFDYMDIGADYVPDAEGCGNGILDTGEECDDGNRNDNDECNNRCLYPRCGDGSLWYGMEDCDPPGTVRPCVTGCGSTGQEWCLPYCRWEGECIPPPESCGNGLDDDCDGIADVIVRLASDVPVSGVPLGSARSQIAWSSSEFDVMWGSYDGSTVLSRLDPWGWKVDWDRVVNYYFRGVFNLSWTVSHLGYFLAVPGYETDYYGPYGTDTLFFHPLYPDGSPISDFVAVARNEGSPYGLGLIQIAHSADRYGILYRRYVKHDPDNESTEFTDFISMSSDGSSISDEVNLGSWNFAHGGSVYKECFVATTSGYTALKRQLTGTSWDLEYLDSSGSSVGSVPIEMPPGPSDAPEYPPLESCVSTGPYLSLIFNYYNESRILVTIYQLDGSQVGSREIFYEYVRDDGIEETSTIVPVGAGSEIGLFWTDTRDGNQEIYFARISTEAELHGGPVRLTHSTGKSSLPSAVWDGSAYAMTWWDSDGINEDILFTRFAPCP